MSKNKEPLVSVIVPTRNSVATLEDCLQSVADQTYKNIELIVVDRDSTDDTKKIAKKFTKKVYNHGPERSAQRNYGVEKASGIYVAIIDSDMKLSNGVVASSVKAMIKSAKNEGVIIPEESFGVGFWAQCKKLERSYYIGNDAIEAARFYKKSTYQKLGGFNIELVSGEDWDLSRRAREHGEMVRIDDLIYHNEGKINLYKTLKKKYYYAQHARNYLVSSETRSMLFDVSGPLARFRMFFKEPRKLLQKPMVGIGMLFMKLLEYLAGSVGYLMSKFEGKTSQAHQTKVTQDE